MRFRNSINSNRSAPIITRESSSQIVVTITESISILHNSKLSKKKLLYLLHPLSGGIILFFGTLLLVVFFFASSIYAQDSILAFPGAEGYGRFAKGGRGGNVIEVTNLNDSGAGSLRAAIEAQGPRIVVFRTAGTIALSRPIYIREANSFLTVAGQTAPGGGIQLKNYGISIRDGAHDIVIRYLRIRPGTADPAGLGGNQIHGIELWGNGGSHIYNIIIDHTSITWGIDENASAWDWVTDSTFQWCIFAEGSMTGHPKGPHSMGLLIGSDTRTTLSIHHSLFAHNQNRNPRHSDGGRIDFRNNLIYNWGVNGSAQFSGVEANFVNNHYINGMDTSASNIVLWTQNNAQMYLDDNWTPDCPTGCTDDWDLGVRLGYYGDEPESNFRVNSPFSVEPVTTHPTSEVKDLVLANAGAILPMRDTVDNRIVQDVQDGTGSLGIGSGYPILAAGTQPLDNDGDGMPDTWENIAGLDPTDSSDSKADLDGNGYTEVEEYLNQLASTTEPPLLVTSEFSSLDSYLGNTNNWEPLTPARWSVIDDSGDLRYGIITTDFSNLSGNRLGEYSLVKVRIYRDFTFIAKVKSSENLGSNLSADYNVIFGFQNLQNYYYMMFNSHAANSTLFKIVDGNREVIATADGFAIPDNNYHEIMIKKADFDVTILFDNAQILKAQDLTFLSGKIGIGGFNDASLWDDIMLHGAYDLREPLQPVQNLRIIN